MDIKRIKALAHPLRADIIKVLGHEKGPTPIKQIADRLKEKPAKLHYHIKQLEEAGFIEVGDTREINGITERYYQLTSADMDVILSYKDQPEAVKEAMPILEHKTLELIRRIPHVDRTGNQQLLGTIRPFHYTPEKAAQAKEALENLLEHKPAQLPEEDEESANTQCYELAVFLVPNNKE